MATTSKRDRASVMLERDEHDALVRVAKEMGWRVSEVTKAAVRLVAEASPEERRKAAYDAEYARLVRRYVQDSDLMERNGVAHD